MSGTLLPGPGSVAPVPTLAVDMRDIHSLRKDLRDGLESLHRRADAHNARFAEMSAQLTEQAKSADATKRICAAVFEELTSRDVKTIPGLASGHDWARLRYSALLVAVVAVVSFAAACVGQHVGAP